MRANFSLRRLSAVLLFSSAFASSVLAGSNTEGSIIVTYEPGSTYVEEVATLDASGTSASVVVRVNNIPLPADEHSPACTPGRWQVGKIWVAGNRLSECARVCIIAPASMEIDAVRGVTGTTSHAWSQVFSTEWYRNEQKMCAHVKNWSSDTPAIATLTIGVCPVGTGCVNSAPAVLPTPPKVTPREQGNPIRERNAMKYL